VEGYNFDARKNVVQYDDVMNRHRRAIYAMRREILRASDISKRIKIMIEDEAAALAASPLLTSDQFEDIVKEVIPFEESTLDRLFDAPADKFGETLKTEAMKFYDARQKAYESDIMHRIERDVYLQILDNLWMQHLENMDHLREGIHWMSVGQRDPLVEYRRQGQILFDDMQATLRHDIVRALFHAQPVSEDELDKPIETELTRAARQSVDNADRIIEAEEFEEKDFKDPLAGGSATKKQKTSKDRKKAHKAERKRRKKAKKRK